MESSRFAGALALGLILGATAALAQVGPHVDSEPGSVAQSYPDSTHSSYGAGGAAGTVGRDNRAAPPSYNVGAGAARVGKGTSIPMSGSARAGDDTAPKSGD